MVCGEKLLSFLPHEHSTVKRPHTIYWLNYNGIKKLNVLSYDVFEDPVS